MMFDFVVFVLVFVLLYEFWYVMYCVDKSVLLILFEEEIGCDNWVCEFMISGFVVYVKEYRIIMFKFSRSV